MSSCTLTVLFADLAGSTRLYQTQGDEQAYRKVSQSLQCMKNLIETHSGQLLRTVGDSALASFTDADAAYLAAVDIQKEHVALDLSVRIGFHPGEVIPDAGDVYGNAVNLAARVAQFAEADEICITEAAVAQLSVAHRSNASYISKVTFKGVSQPMSVYRVLWDHDNVHTAIVSNKRNTARFQTDHILELQIGTRSITVCPDNKALTIGRADNNDLVVDGESASRNHAQIELVRGRYILHDSSTNGSYVIRGSNAPEFVLRESVELDQSGMIGLGIIPNSADGYAIHYRRYLPD